MIYVNKFPMPFTDIAFDIDNNKIYAGIGDHGIAIYDYTNYSLLGTFNSKGEASSLYFDNNELVVVNKMMDNSYNIEIIDINESSSEDSYIHVLDSYPKNN